MCLFALTIVVFQLGTVSLQSLNEKRVQDTACFGTGFHAFINANCSSTEKIYPLQLNAGAKFSSSGCPLEMESNATALLVQQCCFPDTANDCMASVNTDTPATASSYIETCVGRETCTTPQAFRMDVLSIASCNSSAFPPQTHYLYLDYYCVPNSKIGRFPTADLTNDGVGSLLYLQGSTYPFQILPTTATCSLETDCSTNIVIYGLHVNFELDNVTCNQAIKMNDTSGILYTVGCSDNDVVSGYRLRTLATSNDNYMEIYYTSLTSNQGLFWLAFKASGNLTINCPRRDPINQCLTTTELTTTTTEPMTTTTTTEPMMTTTTTTEPMTTTTTTEPMTTTTTTEPMTTTTTTEPMTTTTTTTTLPPSTGASSADEGSTNMIIIIVVVVAVSLILALVAVLVYRKCYKKKCGRNTDEEQSAARNDGQQETNSLQRTSTINVAEQNRHENEGDPEVGDVGALTTIISPSNSEVNNVQHTDDKQQKRKKKKKKKRKVQSEENNEDVSHSDKVQPAASNIHKTEDYDEENVKKRKKRHKRNDNSIYPEPSFEPDDVPTQDHATESNKSKRKKKRKKTRKPQENMTADGEDSGTRGTDETLRGADETLRGADETLRDTDEKLFSGDGEDTGTRDKDETLLTGCNIYPEPSIEPDDVTTQDHATESNKSKKKKKRKKTRKPQENMTADGEDSGTRDADETSRDADES